MDVYCQKTVQNYYKKIEVPNKMAKKRDMLAHLNYFL